MNDKKIEDIRVKLLEKIEKELSSTIVLPKDYAEFALAIKYISDSYSGERMNKMLESSFCSLNSGFNGFNGKDYENYFNENTVEKKDNLKN